MNEVLAVLILADRARRAIRRKLARGLRASGSIALKDVEQWAIARGYLDVLGDAAYIRQVVRDEAEDWCARSRYRP
jgi:hypothetical protein